MTPTIGDFICTRNKGEKMLEIKTACPYCFKPLVHGYYCQFCHFVMKEKKGIFHLHRNDATWKLCLKQVIAARKAEDVYIADHKDINKVVEEKPERYLLAANQNVKMFNVMMDVLGDINEKYFLDLGGKNGWLSKCLLEKNAKEGAVLDIDEEEMIPSTDNLMSVLGDGYFIPFPNESFHFVVDCSSLHHFEDKVALLKEIHRVLKSGGTYVSIGNPPRKGFDDDDRTRYMDEFGLIETMPNEEEYTNFFKEGFGVVNYIPVEDNMVMHVTKE